jgi:hypothetical protein
VFADNSENLLGVGWLERYGETNLYDTVIQDLITFSLPHDTLFHSIDRKVVVGSFSFVVPTNAGPNDSYQISIGRPSATTDGIGRPGSDVFIDTPIKGTIRAVTNVTIGVRKYMVGDAAPFRWFNAGDFGNNDLRNDDLEQVFQSAMYGLNTPPRGSDFYDSLDSSDGATLGLFDGNDRSIDQIAFGDGSLNVDDVFVTFRRSLDPALVRYVRFWSNGVLRAETTTNAFRPQASSPSSRSGAPQASSPADGGAAPSVTFSAQNAVGAGGEIVSVSVNADITGAYPLRVLMLNLNVIGENGAPALTDNVQFIPSQSLGQPTLTSSHGPANYGAAWLDNTVPGLTGASEIGKLVITIPAGAAPNSSYKVEFEHASGSPNGVSLFRQTVNAVNLASTWNDGIPDVWRLKFFGSLSSALSGANADPDGDGVSNLAEFTSGTDPLNASSALRLSAAHKPGTSSGVALRWLSAAGKTYVIECAPALSGASWKIIASGLLGDGSVQEYTDGTSSEDTRFYRVRIEQ